MLSEKNSEDLHALVNFVNISRQLAVLMLLGELERRFSSENTDILGGLEALDAKLTYLHYTTLSSLVVKFGACLNIDSALLKIECEWAKTLIADGRSILTDLYPNLFKVITISKTLPGRTATVLGSFGARNRILSWACNSLDSWFTNGIMLLSMNKDLLKNINLSKVLNRWTKNILELYPSNCH